jgi:hypothetical protein
MNFYKWVLYVWTLNADMLLHKLINDGLYLFLSRQCTSVSDVQNFQVTQRTTQRRATQKIRVQKRRGNREWNLLMLLDS